MRTSTPIYLFIFLAFITGALGFVSVLTASGSTHSSYSGIAFFMMIIAAVAAIVTAPFASRAFLNKPRK
ncbi:hypothetical protein [Stenotrophomonas sp.]|uniref:hypothetical protein n=1 Tax=Stenotrophomonas sp. TaxID=69392 RepID=UPI0028A25529|nr:hypothetical protein [Stenotrophomonas sp.]